MRTATLIITDEVNVKIKGLELTERKDLVNKFKIEIPYARHMPAVKLGRWDGKVSYFQLGGSTFVNLLPDIIPLLIDRGYEIEIDDRREYETNFKFEEINEASYSDRQWPSGHPLEGQPIMLRDYQVEVVNKFLTNTQCLQEVSTGAGKTITTAVLSHVCEPYGRSIIIVPNTDLVGQTYTDYVNMGLSVGVFHGKQKDYGKQHTICTWQSLNSMFKKTKKGEAVVSFDDFIDGVVCLIVDECHTLKADVLKAMLTGPMAHIPIRWGVTGTVPKEEHSAITLRVSVGEVINHVRASDLQAKGVLANCHVNVLQFKDFVEYTDYQSEQKYLLTDDKRLTDISSVINSQIRPSGNTLILVDRISAGEALAEKIEGSIFISGGVKNDVRKEHYDSVTDSEDKVIIATYGVAAVGLNIVKLHNVVLIEPGKSFVRVIQSIGRGLRKGFDKDSVMIWDVSSTCKFAKRHLAARKKFYKEANYDFTITKVDRT